MSEKDASWYTWELKLSLSGGFDSNPANLGTDLPLPSDLEQRGSGLVEGEVKLTLDYDFAKLERTPDITNELKLSYDFIADVYSDISGNDQYLHVGVASYKHSLSTAIVGELRLTDKFLQIDGENLDNLFQVRPALSFDESKILPFLKVVPILDTFEVAYAFSTYTFFGSAASVHNQDRHSLIATQIFSLSKVFGTELDLAYLHVWNFAQGKDYDFDENAIEAEFLTNFAPKPEEGVRESFLRKLSIDLVGKYHFDRYSNPNSQVNFIKNRSDDYWQISASLAYKINATWTANVVYTYIKDASNIPVYHFDEHIASLGLTATY